MISPARYRTDVPHAELAAIVEFLDSRRRPITEKDRKEGPYPYYGANGIQGYVDGYLFDEPLVLIAEDGGHFEDPDRGIAFKVSGKTWVNNHAHVLKPNPAKVNIDYLVRVLEHLDVTPFINGSTRAKLTKGNAERIRIPLPNLAEQERIAATLEKAYAIRKKRELAISRLDQLAQSMFVEMFGDVAPSNKRFPLVPLSTLCSRITDGTHQSPKWEVSGIPFLFISNIVDGQIRFDTHKYISDETHKELTRRCPIEVGDVLYTTVGSYGNVAVVNTPRKFAFQRHIAHIKPNPDRVVATFLAAMLTNSGVRRQVDTVARGVAQKTVNLSDLKALQVFEVPMGRQREFAAVVERIGRIIDHQLAALRASERLAASISQGAFGS